MNEVEICLQPPAWYLPEDCGYMLELDKDGNELERFAAARLHNCNIQVNSLDDECKIISTYTYSAVDASRTVCIARLGSYFALKNAYSLHRNTTSTGLSILIVHLGDWYAVRR
ncbi:uncharacterized protein PITG_09918 [Phytophthora infestans T30-4]|uniref:Uncharacterized protein n=1 Tax=Phytophthora infestans (strain T30-4) TaxID=403677 RepID=D0NDU7_PHYIT|nr:uncharacterized protein PITG_09918 [Phytophthora infestans T30-4]EEY56392.1 hypothetical protein PITG_09918 [Phytophthora infestans T30-4]|eukprot:XP_002902466.1 hypothetical protein PITG_09918 [Phytophthora infestans T30-4]